MPRLPLLAMVVWLLAVMAAHAIGFQHISGEEAHYWTWSRRPLDWGYFSKPPLIAWLHALTTSVFGSSVFGLRFWSHLANATTVLIGAQLAYEVTRRPAAAHLSAGLLMLSIATTADPNRLQNCFWVLTVYGVWRATQVSPHYWLLAGAAFSLGVLGKHSVAFLLPSLVLYIAVYCRPHLRLPVFWGGVGLAAVPLAPHGWWLLVNEGVTVQHTAGLGTQLEPFQFSHIPHELVGFLTALAYDTAGFGIVVYFAVAAWGILRVRTHPHQALIVLLLTSAGIVFGFYLILALFRDTLPHWLEPAYLSLTLLAGIWIGTDTTPMRSRLAGAAFAVGLLFAMLNILDPYSDPRGKIMAARVHEAMEATGADFVLSHGYQHSFLSWAEFYLPGQPMGRTLFRGVIESQFDLWQDVWHNAVGEDGIFITPYPEHLARDLADSYVSEGFFASTEHLGAVILANPGSPHEQAIQIFVMREYSGHQIEIRRGAPVSRMFAGMRRPTGISDILASGFLPIAPDTASHRSISSIGRNRS